MKDLALNAGILSGAIVLCGAVIYLGYRVFTKSKPSSTIPIQKLAELAAAELLEDIATLRRKCAILQVYTSEYFNTMNEAGWGDLWTILDNLKHVEQTVSDLTQAKRYSDLLEFCSFLGQGLTGNEERAAKDRYYSYSGLAGWRTQSSDILDSVVAALEVAANKTREIGVTRKRAKSTLIAIADIRDHD